MFAFDLWGKHPGETIYIVGTGPSQRLFPIDFLEDKTTIGLNQAWKYAPMTYSITVHPEHIWDHEHTEGANLTKWVVTSRRKRSAVRYTTHPETGHKRKHDIWFSAQHCEHYVFDPVHGAQALDEPALLDRRGSDNRLYQAHGVHNSAMWLAARMGAKTVILVGVDMTDLGGEHHAHEQHIRWCGASAEDAYKEYRDDAFDTRKRLRSVGVSVLTLTPFLGSGHAEEDYRKQKKEMGLEDLPEPEDISPYTRPDLEKFS